MIKTAVLIAEGYEEIEALTIIDLLRRAEINVDIVGLTDGPITGAHGIKIHPEITIDEYSKESLDALFLPGGSPGWINLGNHEAVLNLIADMNEKKMMIGAICAAPAVLAKAGILNGKKCTIYPGMECELAKGGGIYEDNIVVVDDNIITSKGPATAIPFSLKIIELLCGKKDAVSVNKKILADMVF